MDGPTLGTTFVWVKTAEYTRDVARYLWVRMLRVGTREALASA
jgi:hypothetical protein